MQRPEAGKLFDVLVKHSVDIGAARYRRLRLDLSIGGQSFYAFAKIPHPIR